MCSIDISTRSLTRRLTFLTTQATPNSFISTRSLTRRLTGMILYCGFPQVHFNSQPHEEADWRTPVSTNMCVHFNSQPHEEADIFNNASNTKFVHFNSQPHEEADNMYYYNPLCTFCHFNSQPHEEADLISTAFPICICHFNSQPHEEADHRSGRPKSHSGHISTRSLTRRLTSGSICTIPIFGISTRSLTRRLTICPELPTF